MGNPDMGGMNSSEGATCAAMVMLRRGKPGIVPTKGQCALHRGYMSGSCTKRVIMICVMVKALLS
jgi:hypothetical protein